MMLDVVALGSVALAGACVSLTARRRDSRRVARPTHRRVHACAQQRRREIDLIQEAWVDLVALQDALHETRDRAARLAEVWAHAAQTWEEVRALVDPTCRTAVEAAWRDVREVLLTDGREQLDDDVPSRLRLRIHAAVDALAAQTARIG